VRLSGDHIETRVSDRGPGLTEDQIEQAFRRFATSRPSSGVDGGFGIGLAIVRRLTELDGGSAQLVRNAHGGIDAVVRLPTAE